MPDQYSRKSQGQYKKHPRPRSQYSLTHETRGALEAHNLSSRWHPGYLSKGLKNHRRTNKNPDISGGRRRRGSRYTRRR